MLYPNTGKNIFYTQFTDKKNEILKLPLDTQQIGSFA